MTNLVERLMWTRLRLICARIATGPPAARRRAECVSTAITAIGATARMSPSRRLVDASHRLEPRSRVVHAGLSSPWRNSYPQGSAGMARVRTVLSAARCAITRRQEISMQAHRRPVAASRNALPAALRSRKRISPGRSMWPQEGRPARPVSPSVSSRVASGILTGFGIRLFAASTASLFGTSRQCLLPRAAHVLSAGLRPHRAASRLRWITAMRLAAFGESSAESATRPLAYLVTTPTASKRR